MAQKLRSTLIFDYANLETLTNYLASLVLVQADEKTPNASASVSDNLADLDSLLTALENSSDAEIAQRLSGHN